ncbi:MAG: tetratricopeptide repeat protein [Phycisphaerae bacterium]
MTRLAAIILACFAVLTGAAEAQQDDSGDVGFGDEPIAGDESSPQVDEAALQAYLATLSEEEMDRLIADAAAARLEAERGEAAAEMQRGLLYDPDEVDAAVGRLREDPENTRSDNIQRICRAFATVDFRLAEPYEHFREGRYDKAAEGLRKLINPNDASYLSAAEHYLLARSLAEAGDDWGALDVYAQLLQRMPDRYSFAADAAERTAELYEQMGRRLYALESYRVCLSNYGLMLSKERFEEIRQRVAELEGIYRAPLTTAGQMMGDVAERLEAADSGEQTRQKQREIVMLLDDLIKTAEESAGSSGNSQGQGQRQRQERQDASQRESSSRGGRAGQPNSPLDTGTLPEGDPGSTDELSRVYEGGESGDWASLPPRQRQKLQEAAEQAMPERYRDMIKDYRTRLAEQRPQ